VPWSKAMHPHLEKDGSLASDLTTCHNGLKFLGLVVIAYMKHFMIRWTLLKRVVFDR
jgi:hypothetical protein